jgi:hypothetical protein
MTTTNGTNNGTDRDGPRQVLADWQDRQVTVSGVVEKLFPSHHPTNPYLVARMQDSEVELPTKARHYLGHLHLQHAEELKHCQGQRIKCRCGVKPYYKKSRDGGEGWTDWCLIYPRDVEVLPGPVFVPTAHEPTNGTAPTPSPAPPLPNPSPPTTPNPLEAIKKIRGLVDKAGGVAALVGFLDALEKIGGWEGACEVMDVADSVGGIAELKELIDMLKV